MEMGGISLGEDGALGAKNAKFGAKPCLTVRFDR